MKRIATFSTQRPLVVILAWIAAVLGLVAVSESIGTTYRDTFSLGGTDSQAAYDLLGERFPTLAGSSDTIAWEVPGGSVTDPAARDYVSAVLARVAAVPDVASVTSPFAPAGSGQISADRTIAYAQVHWDGSGYAIPASSIHDVGRIVSEANGHDGLTIGFGGQGAMRLSAPHIGVGEIIGVAIAAVILLVAFGSLLAVTVPLAGALVSLGGAVGALGLFSHAGPLSTYSPMLAVLLGLGIGIDYALFITNRHRIGLKAGRPVGESVVAATVTSGRAVVFAGATVFIALAGMFVPRISFLTGLAAAAAVTVAFSVAVSISLVPALLQLYGTRILNRRDRRALDAREDSDPTVTRQGAIARFFERHAVATSLAALAALIAIALPTFGLRLGNADQGNDPLGTTTRTAYDIVAKGFGPGANGPLLVAVDATNAHSPTALPDLVSRISADPGVVAAVGPIPDPTGTAAIIQVMPATGPQDSATVDLVHRIRDTYAAAAATDGLAVHVGGAVATNVDFAHEIALSLPLFFVIVIGLSMLVLAAAFRSIVLPAVGALLNLFSAGAAFGVIVAVFQWGWGHSIIGVGEGGPIEPFVPVILFALLFGLSMDYQVFLVTRIAELWHATHDNALAVRRGLAEVSRVIVAAAAIMVVVFGSFVTSEARVVKLLGLGLASAVFLDAFVIRVTIMPAVMRLLGRGNWWMPRWLDRLLPRFDLDGDGGVSASAELEKVPVRV